MRKTFIFIATTLLITSFLLLPSCQRTQSSKTGKPTPLPKINVNVEIIDFAFTPDGATITKGGKVTWENKDSANHTVSADNGEFDSGQLSPGQTFTQNFAESGSFEYHCENHPSMTGRITVK